MESETGKSWDTRASIFLDWDPAGLYGGEASAPGSFNKNKKISQQEVQEFLKKKEKKKMKKMKKNHSLIEKK